MNRRPFPALLLAAAIASFPAIARAADEAPPRLRTITVSGEGEATGAPDVAVTALGVEALDPKLGDAISDTSRRMRAVLEAVKRAGVAPRDIRTVEYSVNFEQNPPPPGSSDGRPSGNYRVRNTAQVTIRDLSRAGDALDAAVAAGANVVSGISFTIEDPAALRARAREAAVADARSRAEALARASGVAVGPVVSISENPGGGPVPRPMLARAMASVAPGAPPIESGELTERSEVEIVFEIGKRGP